MCRQDTYYWTVCLNVSSTDDINHLSTFLMGLFQIKEGIDFTLISVHFKASDCASKDLKKEEEDRNMIYGIIKEVRQQVTG